jgi:hypothetical protein
MLATSVTPVLPSLQERTTSVESVIVAGIAWRYLGAPAVYFLEYPFQGLPTERGIPEHHRTTRRSRVVLSYNERAMRDVTKVGAFVGVVDTYAFSEAQGDG